MTRVRHAPTGRGRRTWRAVLIAQQGQSLSEYLTVVGLMAATVIGCMALFVAPVARVFIELFRKLVLNFTSVP